MSPRDGANAPVLGGRALSRATLERQLLLRRAELPVLDAVRRLVGLQGQVPAAPYLGLWSRLAGFALDDLTGLINDRQVVRATVMRGTLHLLSAADYRWLRPLMQPLLRRLQRGFMGRSTEGMDLGELVETARRLLGEQPLSRTTLRRLLGERWPDRDPSALLHTIQYLVPLIHLPPAGTWRGSVTGPCALAEQWLGAPLADATPEPLVRRYLAAFGPASVADLQAWSGLTRLGEVVEPLRPHLRRFRGEDGRELFDLPDAPRPDPDTPAPPRFLPAYDNLLLAHADRTRVIDEAYRKRVSTPAVAPTVLVDGFVRGTWTMRREGDGAVLRIEPFERLSAADTDLLAREGDRLLAFAEADAAGREVRFG